MKKLITFCIAITLTFFVKAQKDFNPFESIGKEGKMLTLSNGKYIEVEMYDSLQRIGSVIINRNTGEIHELLPIEDTSEFRYDPTTFSRWYSLDPMAAKYSDLSPYNFVANNPILLVDADGREIIIRDPKTGETHIYLPNSQTPENASEFVRNAYLGLDYLYNLKTPDNLNRVNRLVKSSETYEISKNLQSQFTAKGSGNHQVTWNDEYAYEMEQSYGLQSPVVALAHELDHGAQFDKGYARYEYYLEKNPTYADKIWTAEVQFFYPQLTYPGDERRMDEENRATSALETFVAKDLNQGVRPDYSINPIKKFVVDNIFSVEQNIKVSALPVRKAEPLEREQNDIIIK